MAKMFYTLDETKATLGKNEEEIKQYSREGRLREFRDGPRLMFKADQVETLKNELAGGDVVGLAPVEEAPLGLGDEPPAPGKGDTHIDLDASAGPGASGAGKAIPLGGSVSGLTNVGSGIGSGAGSGAGGTRSGGGGITIFDVDDSQKADPSAQTSINASVQDQISLEAVGSGSGLLDLTRESDDTSLGAVFDELKTPAPGGRGKASVAMEETQAAETVQGVDSAMPVSSPIYVDQPDVMGTALGAAALGVAIIVLITGFLLWGSIMGYRPALLDSLQWEGSLKMYLIGAVGGVLVFFGAGYALGRMEGK